MNVLIVKICFVKAILTFLGELLYVLKDGKKDYLVMVCFM